MNRMDILEAMYEVIKNSTEWGIDCKDGCYGQYVDGVVAMTDAMLEKEKIREDRLMESARKYINNHDDLTNALQNRIDC